MNHHCITLALITFVVTACGSSSVGHSDTPQTATGETPIRYVICGPGGDMCLVAARFSDFDGCESHKKWSEMLCDSKSNPGQMACREDSKKIGTAYCTK